MPLVEFVIRTRTCGCKERGIAKSWRLRCEHALTSLHVVTASSDHALLVAIVNDRLAPREIEQPVTKPDQIRQHFRGSARIVLLQKIREAPDVVVAQNVVVACTLPSWSV